MPGKVDACLLTPRTTRKWRSRESNMKNMVILSAQKHLTSDTSVKHTCCTCNPPYARSIWQEYKTCIVHVFHPHYTWWTVLGNLSGFEKVFQNIDASVLVFKFRKKNTKISMVENVYHPFLWILVDPVLFMYLKEKIFFNMYRVALSVKYHSTHFTPSAICCWHFIFLDPCR